MKLLRMNQTCGKLKDTNYVHPTQKPVELSVRAFGNHIKLINVLDLFMVQVAL